MSNSRSRPNNKGVPGNKGGGRPPGPSKALTRLELNRIPEEKQPVHIMLKNMWWWDEQGDLFASEIAAGLDEIKDLVNDDDKVAAVDKIKKKFDAFVHARDKAQSCAVDAAPYCHAKLQSIVMKPSTTKRVVVETMVASTGDRNEEVEYRKNYDPTNVTPIRKSG